MKVDDMPRLWIYSSFPLFHLWSVASAQIVYSLAEESDPGTTVGNLAKDLHLDGQDLGLRGLQISGPNARYLEVSGKTGMLVVRDRIDREELCSRRVRCSLEVEAVANAPLNLFRFELQIVDINDNAPYFRLPEIVLNVSESAFTGERFALPKAFDADVGGYSVKSYKVSQNEHFSLDVQHAGEQPASAELVLRKALDREKHSVIKLTLTALDGGKPVKTGTLQVTILVQDVNDNLPIFDDALYKATVTEDAPRGTSVLSVHAGDLDEGVNGEIVYSFINHDGDSDVDKFAINSVTGEITVNGQLDHEKANAVEIRVQAKDKGWNSRASHCKVLIEIIDINDNPPQISVTSLVDVVREDAPLDTIVGLLTVKDNDTDKNGLVNVRIVEHVPFKIKNTYKNHYSLVVDGALDREQVSKYKITISASDEGVPSLSSTSVMTVQISDINDNVPRFREPVIHVFVEENSPAGAVIYTMSADDPDVGENAKIFFSLIHGNNHNDDVVRSNININSESGDIVSLQSFDYETLQTLEFKVQATDGGVPPLSGNVSVNLFILDQNDNSPRILPPYSEHGSANGESVPYSAEAGYFVAKIRAVDADSGYNALLSYQLSEPKGGNGPLFRIGSGSGEIRTRRRMSEDDLKSHPLVVSVCDHGEASLSATVSIDVLVLESTADIRTQFRHVPRKEESFSRLHLYLLIAIAAVSLVFLLSLLAFVAFKCRRRTDGGAPVIAAHPDGSWSYSKATQQYDVCLGSDTLKSDLVLFPAAFPPAEAELISIHGGDTFTRTQTLPNSEKPKVPNSDWRYSASLRAGGVMQSSVHMEESSVMQGAQGVLVQNWPTASSAADAEGGEVSPPMGAGVDSNSWHFRYGPGGPGGPPQHLKAGDVPPEAFIIPGSPAIISIRQNQGGEDDKSDFITFGKKEEAKKKKKKKKDKKDKKGKDDDE
ncbi:protocadherin alpha-8-like isoform X3 [Syngnathoides biaculeatus]|uniref:protocadherin alpha-8-like isoform X3 n=1 Tax=Syngnathoides biaculeatus TaxID=300417 RepID=UPI002ADE9567|nr:protocadherin alpha-8-like isoform X3 [Syngnathoides biaculeatus]